MLATKDALRTAAGGGDAPWSLRAPMTGSGLDRLSLAALKRGIGKTRTVMWVRVINPRDLAPPNALLDFLADPAGTTDLDAVKEAIRSASALRPSRDDLTGLRAAGGAPRLEAVSRPTPTAVHARLGRQDASD